MDITWYRNDNGPLIGTALGRVIERDGCYFRDLHGTGELLDYLDWRLDPETRARDLASRLSVEETAGLMLYSSHQLVPALPGGPFPGTYQGEPYDATRHQPSDLTDQQREFIARDGVRHVLVTRFADVPTAVSWQNAMQGLAEGEKWGIPINFSSDPRHGSAESGAEFKSSGASVSKWPEGLGIAATFSVDTARAFGEVAAQEYRALGITTALWPQMDLATEPRWMRAVDTFGGNIEQVIDLARAVCDGLQTTPDSPNGWGSQSVIAMAKHWPGGGTGEGGRDAHYRFGMYNVYPSGNFAAHLRPFTEGAFRLDGPTGSARAIMPYYSVSHGAAGDEVGNSYDQHLIKDLLRGTYGYEGVICTDWGITGDPGDGLDGFQSRCYGVEDLSVAERHLRIIMNGVDQFGGNNAAGPIIEAHRLGCERHGESAMRARLEESAVRLLTGMILVGLFENPYLDAEASRATVGREDFVAAGYRAQLASIVLLKDACGPIPERRRVFVPSRHIDAHKGFFRNVEPARDLDGLDPATVAEHFDVVATPGEADFAIVVLESPICDPYVDDTFRPISLQWRPYRADAAREPSLAGDRSYRGQEAVVANASDLDNLEAARRAMGDKPVIAVVQLNTAPVMSEVEPLADRIIAHFGVSDRALLAVIAGQEEAGGRLPVSLPASMETIESHCEDAFDDYEPYVDSQGNAYRYGFGLRR